ncbi:hypothetical protein Niako_1232 [Niastella koreensis GR20-10]|uniref:Uncharacterized protein n=1 Tax=Niastella koreensis (strain DSM 17620 / KACC 11465 / NBRC 106392 / GR20-10) TaxID=700598 RepID=G8TKF1_NIAKG|nr:hypothetical protein Niako_1232 [Niastella koreensis GR20-10]
MYNQMDQIILNDFWFESNLVATLDLSKAFTNIGLYKSAGIRLSA